MAVEEEESGECLVLPEGHRDGVCGGGDVEGDGEVGEEGLDGVGAEGARVFEAVEAEESADPLEVGGFSAEGVVSAGLRLVKWCNLCASTAASTGAVRP
jgi:hypothetical protein